MFYNITTSQNIYILYPCSKPPKGKGGENMKKRRNLISVILLAVAIVFLLKAILEKNLLIKIIDFAIMVVLTVFALIKQEKFNKKK